MDAGVIIVIVVVVLILLALFAFLGRKSRDRKHEADRHEAKEIRREAEVGRAQADRSRAEADVQAAEARRQDALARERSVEADDKHREARDRHLEAARKDPDVDEDQAAAEYDREHGQDKVTAHGYGEGENNSADQRVEHHERTETPEGEHERHYERDEQGEVVRDEESREDPRTTR